MSRTANIANNLGVTMDQLIGYVATMGEVTQKEMSSIGESMKTILSRMSNVKLGKFLSDDGEEISNVESILNSFNIKLRDSNLEFRDFSEVLNEVGQSWTSYSSVQKAAIANAFAGVRQQENFQALMGNWGKAVEYAAVSANSSGTAMEKFAFYENSVEASTKRLQATWESFINNTFTSDSLKGIIEAGTSLVTVFDWLVNKSGGLAGILLKVTVLWLALTLAQKGNLLTTIKQNAQYTILALKETILAIKTGNLALAFQTLNSSAGLVLIAIVAITAAIWLISEAMTYETKALEKQEQKLQDTQVEYDELKSKIQELNGELETTQLRIDELNNKDKLSLVEQEELYNLKQANIELERQISLLDKQAKKAAEKQAKETQETVNKRSSTGVNGKYVVTYGNDGTILEDRYYNELEKFELYLNDVKKLKDDVQQDPETAMNLAEYTTELDKLAEAYKPLIESYDEAIADGYKLDESQQNQYNTIKKLINAYDSFIDPVGAYTAKLAQAQLEFDKVWDTSSYDNVKEKLNELYEANNLTAASLHILTFQFPELQQFMDKTGLSAQQLADYINYLIESENKASEATSVFTKSLATIYGEIKDKAELASKAQKEMSDSGVVSVDTMMSLIDSGLATEEQFVKTAKGFALTKSVLDSLRGSTLQAYQTDFDNALSAAQTVLGAEKTKQSAYDATTKSIIAQLKARLELLTSEGTVTVVGSYVSVNEEYTETLSALQNINKAIDNLDKAGNLFDSISYGGSGGGKGKTALEKLDDALKDYLETVERQIKLLSYQEGTEQEQIRLYKELQDKLVQQAKLYRSKGLDENSEYIKNLQIQWHDYQKDIESVYEAIAKKQEEANKQAFDELSNSVDQYKDNLKSINEDDNQKYEDRINLLKDQRDLFEQTSQAEIDALKEKHDMQEKENRLLELQNSLIEKQLELANASKEKTVKILEGTQWKWISDPTTIKNLQDAITEAQNAYNTEVAEQNYEASIRSLENAQKAALQGFDNNIKILEAEIKTINDIYENSIKDIDDRLKDAENMLNGSASVIVNTMDALNDAFQKFISVVSSGSVGSSGSGVNGSSTSAIEDISTMQNNSAKWWDSSISSSEKEKMHQENANIAASHGWSFDSASGKWLDNSGIPIYHGGTPSVGGGGNLGQKELFALLEKVETILTPNHMTNLGKLLTNSISNTNFIRNNNSQSSNSENYNFYGGIHANDQGLDKIIKAAKMMNR